MDKQALIDKLRKLGYKVAMESSVIMVLTDDHKLGVYKNVKQIIESSGYNASWGVRYDSAAHTPSQGDAGSYSEDLSADEEINDEEEKAAGRGKERLLEENINLGEDENGQISFL